MAAAETDHPDRWNVYLRNSGAGKAESKERSTRRAAVVAQLVDRGESNVMNVGRYGELLNTTLCAPFLGFLPAGYLLAVPDRHWPARNESCI